MARSDPQKLPKYRLHKPPGRALVTLSGRDVYLGAHDTEESRSAYERVVGEWLTRGRTLPIAGDCDGVTVVEVLASYWTHAQTYYVKDGRPTSYLLNLRRIIRTVRVAYGRTAAAQFSPLALKSIIRGLIDEGLARPTVNDYASMIKAIFKWAVAEGMIPPSVWHGLQAVSGLRAGRSPAREPAPIRPVSDEVVKATLPHLSSIVAAMVRVQRLTGARPGEICSMTTGQIDTAGKVWIYRPASHKTQHFGKERVVALGPRAQSAIRPFLRTELEKPIFSPGDAEAERRAMASAARKTPLNRGNLPGANRRREPKRRPKDSYTTSSYGRAIARGCDAAFPAPGDLGPAALAEWRRQRRWHPNQLRHTRATEVRAAFGLESAGAVLGHSNLDVTQVYAERNERAAVQVAMATG